MIEGVGGSGVVEQVRVGRDTAHPRDDAQSLPVGARARRMVARMAEELASVRDASVDPAERDARIAQDVVIELAKTRGCLARTPAEDTKRALALIDELEARWRR